jgi:two-component system, chemotaxis family, response regulator PixG
VNTVEKLTLGHVLAQLQGIKSSQQTGVYTIHAAGGQSWKLLFRLGRLVWCSGGEHRFRRWQRCLRQHCPGLESRSIRLRSQEVVLDEWEYTAISVLIMRQQISREIGIAIVQQSVHEVFFDILQSLDAKTQLVGQFEALNELKDPLVLLDPEHVLQTAQQTWNQWFSAGLGALSPNLAPVIKQPEQLEQRLNGQTFISLRSFITGNTSLRDLAVQMKRDPLAVTKSLAPYMQQGLMGLQAIADSAKPDYQLVEVNVSVSTHQPLIICIDDNINVCQTMSEVLTKAGYRFMAIHDSFQALPTLLSQKPSLVFLDLVMPVANGYEICAQIRRVSALKNVPVVILTGNDGIVDRVRAKMVGASDFLSKPVESDKVLSVIQRQLGTHPSASISVSSPTLALD